MCNLFPFSWCLTTRRGALPAQNKKAKTKQNTMEEMDEGIWEV